MSVFSSVGDPDRKLAQDPHDFGPPGSISGSISQKVWIRIRILPFSHNGIERTEIMLAKLKFLHKILAKNLFFKTEDNMPAGKL